MNTSIVYLLNADTILFDIMKFFPLVFFIVCIVNSSSGFEGALYLLHIMQRPLQRYVTIIVPFSFFSAEAISDIPFVYPHNLATISVSIIKTVLLTVLAISTAYPYHSTAPPELFWLFTEEITEISFGRSLWLILSVLLETVRAFFHMSDSQMEELVAEFMSRLPE